MLKDICLCMNLKYELFSKNTWLLMIKIGLQKEFQRSISILTFKFYLNLAWLLTDTKINDSFTGFSPHNSTGNELSSSHILTEAAAHPLAKIMIIFLK